MKGTGGSVPPHFVSAQTGTAPLNAMTHLSKAFSSKARPPASNCFTSAVTRAEAMGSSLESLPGAVVSLVFAPSPATRFAAAFRRGFPTLPAPAERGVLKCLLMGI